MSSAASRAVIAGFHGPQRWFNGRVGIETLDQRRLAALLAAGRGLVAQLQLDAVLEELLRVACELTGAQYAALGVLNDERTELGRFVTRGIDAETQAAIGDLPHGRGVLGVLIREQRPLRLEDVSKHPASYGFPAHHPPMRTFLGVPVLIRGEPWGNLYLTEKASGTFDESDEAAVIVLADWAAIAVENARLYEDAGERRDEAEHAVRRLEAAMAIARAVGSETDLDRVLELVVKRGRALVDARSVVLLLAEHGHLHLAAAAGEVAPGAIGTRFPISGSTAGAILHAGRPERIADVSTRLGMADQSLGVPDSRTALLVPLIYRGTPHGLLAAFDRSAPQEGFADEDERLLVAFAASAATAVATARSVADDRLRHSLAAAEQERRRWARELHDETLQAFGALQVLLASALRRSTPDAIEQAAREAVEHIGTEIENLRTLITELRPAALDELGLQPALESLTRRMATVEGLELDLAVEVGGRLDRDLETTVYRLVQEALTNIGKHARADRVSVHVELGYDALRVEIRDDGRGFDPQSPAEGFGLLGMRERVTLAGGELDVTSRPGETVIRATLPATAAA
jgi:two-component system, NarL family, sensor histidine kinase DevS